MMIHRFLAMTAAELASADALPGPVGWMACHFSSCTPGLSNLPSSLPVGSLLILNDRIPIAAHDPDVIARQLCACLESLVCWGLLLDFQRPGAAEALALAKHLSRLLPCPVGVSDLYARELTCPVFLPPVPPDVPVSRWLAPWQGREIWLDLAPAATLVTLTPEGSVSSPAILPGPGTAAHRDDALHCHYRIRLREERAEFLLWRTREDLQALLEEAAPHGVTTSIGLYQELSPLS